jgi:hypothetical protein
VKFEDLPEPEHKRMTFWEFLKMSWYWYLIGIPFSVFNDEIVNWIAWLADLINPR